MARQRQTTKKQKQPYILAMALIGAGLLVLGIVALVMLPKPEASAQSEAKKEAGVPSAIPAEVNFPAPDVTVRDLDGNEIKISDFQGQTVLLNNWATWCPPCRAEMPALQAFYEDHRHQKFTIVAIESGEPPQEVADFVEQYGLTFPVLVDRSQRTLVAFRNNGLPNSYLIDPQGQVRLAWNGAISREVLEKYVTPLIEN